MDFMDELAANAFANAVGIVWYSGNGDALTTHFSTDGLPFIFRFCIVALPSHPYLCSCHSEYNVWRHSRIHLKARPSWFDIVGKYAGLFGKSAGGRICSSLALATKHLS
jgi:hypothetical protein